MLRVFFLFHQQFLSCLTPLSDIFMLCVWHKSSSKEEAEQSDRETEASAWWWGGGGYNIPLYIFLLTFFFSFFFGVHSSDACNNIVQSSSREWDINTLICLYVQLFPLSLSLTHSLLACLTLLFAFNKNPYSRWINFKFEVFVVYSSSWYYCYFLFPPSGFRSERSCHSPGPPSSLPPIPPFSFVRVEFGAHVQSMQQREKYNMYSQCSARHAVP